MRFALCLSVLLACSPGGDRPIRDGGGGGDPDLGGGAEVGPRPDIGRADSPLECSGTTATAESAFAPVDIVWVIDNSGSMREEADLVQRNINNFAAAVEGVGLDLHVVVITSGAFITVPPPLGADPERFLRVPQDVQSSNSLERLLGTLPMYEDFLRRRAALHFDVVTDDESAMPAEGFLSTMQGNLGRSFRFHSIASPPGSTHSFGPFGMMDGCEGPNGEAADNGEIYWRLSELTGGLRLSICSEDWTLLFNDLTRAISVPQSLPCSYTIPPPPAGEAFDRNLVNVEYTPGTGGATQLIPGAGTFENCTGEGWYYDGGTEEAPARVELCPASCGRVEGDADGRIDITFGCETILI
ncbi:MAG: hypothetical protein AAF411_18820 [Myxococcota bacterium]